MRNKSKPDPRSKHKDRGHPICKHCQKKSHDGKWLLCKQCKTTEIGSMAVDDSDDDDYKVDANNNDFEHF